MRKNNTILATILISSSLALGACVTEDTPPVEEPIPTTPAEFSRAITRECGEMPWPEPGFTVTQSGGRSCMSDAEYLARDLHQQAVERWGVCVEVALCRLRGECGR